MFDLQINGFASEKFYCNFWESPEDESINALNDYLYKEGVEKYLATLITASYNDTETNLQRIHNYCKKYGREAIVGVHIEGGLISRMGVHPPEHAQALDYQAAKKLLEKFPGLIKLWTLCPRIDTQGQVTRLLQDHNIVVSYGHSDASYQEAYEAFTNYNVRLVTHWGNAMYVMKDFKQRDTSETDLARLDTESPEQGGLGLAAYRHPEVVCMAIAGSNTDHDLHLDPCLLKKLFEQKKNKMILVSDMVAKARHCNSLSSLQGAVGDEAISLVGGLAPLSKHAANAIAAGIPEDDVIKACTTTPQLINS